MFKKQKEKGGKIIKFQNICLNGLAYLLNWKLLKL